jgi:DnaJ-domain-containing protein 1
MKEKRSESHFFRNIKSEVKKGNGLKKTRGKKQSWSHLLTLEYEGIDHFYKVLGLDIKSSEEEIKKQYRVLSMKWHPDRNLDNKEFATNKFAEISDAYHNLIKKHE